MLRARFVRFSPYTLAFASTFALSCGPAPTPEEGELGTARSNLDSDVLGFESTAGWTTSSGTLQRSTDASQGAAALAVVSPVNYTTITSPAITSQSGIARDLVIGGSLSVDLKLPAQQPNQYWFGAMQVFVSVPSRGVNNAYLGQKELTGKPTGVYQTYTFGVPDSVGDLLAGVTYSDLKISIVLNVPSSGTGTYLLDALGGFRPTLTPVRIEVVIASNDSGGQTPTVTPADLRAVVKTATAAYARTNIEFLFDPESDIARVNSTLLSHDCTLAAGANLNAPKDMPPGCDGAPHKAERTRVAQNYPGKLVAYFSSGDTLTYDDTALKWVYGPRGNAFSGSDIPFVAMATSTGHQGGLAHEMGHYFSLDHTFNQRPTTIADAQKIVRDYVAAGHPAAQGLQVFDADIGTISDTPPDPGHFLYLAEGLDPCNPAQSSFPFTVTLASGASQTYTVQADRPNMMDYWDDYWLPNCPGRFSFHFSPGQATRILGALQGNRAQLIAQKRLYTAVWEPGNLADSAVVGWTQTDVATRIVQELNSGRHIAHLQAYDIGGGQPRWDAVFEAGDRNTQWVIGWAFNDFVAQFNTQVAAGRHLVHQQAYDIGGGQIRYDAVWEGGDRNTSAVIGWTLSDFVTHFNQEIAAQRHLVHQQAYNIGGGQFRWDGVWESGDRGNFAVLAFQQGDFAKQMSQQIAAGHHIVSLQVYDFGGGQFRWDGVWENGDRGNWWAGAWTFNDFVERNEQELAAGRHLAFYQGYDMGGGQIRYDGVWENGATSQSHIYAESLFRFTDRYSAEIAAGHHMVLMQSFTGK